MPDLDKSKVTLGVACTAVIILISSTGAGAWWCATITNRLASMERVLDIASTNRYSSLDAARDKEANATIVSLALREQERMIADAKKDADRTILDAKKDNERAISDIQRQLDVIRADLDSLKRRTGGPGFGGPQP